MKTKKIPMRRCVGCMESKPKKELMRIVADEELGIRHDTTGKAKGRGVYLCPNASCIENAKKRRAIPRGLNVTVTETQIDAFMEGLSVYEIKNP